MGPVPGYTATAMPGKNDKVSGTAGSSSNLLINRYIPEDKQKAAVDFIKFITSDEIQKEFFLTGQLFSPINELYDEESCKKIECEVAIGARPYSYSLDEPEYLEKKYYSTKVKEYAYDYIYNDADLDYVIKKIIDLKKIYKVTLGTEDSNIGLIIFIISTSILFLMGLHLIIYTVKTKFKNNASFFPNDIWILSLVGAAIMVCTNFTIYGDVTVVKCYLQMIIFNIGFYINIVPILIELVANFPINTKYTMWFSQQKNKYKFICIMILAQIILMGFSMIKTYTVDIMIIVDGENYQYCMMNNLWGKIFANAVEIIQIIMHFILLFLYFTEWNLKDSTFEIRLLFSLSVVDILCSFIYQVLKRINFKNYIHTNLILFLIISIIPVSNFIFIYLLKLKVLVSRVNSLENIIEEIRKPNEMNNSSISSSNIIKTSTYQNFTDSNTSEPRSRSFDESFKSNKKMSRLMMCHFQQSRKESLNQ